MTVNTVTFQNALISVTDLLIQTVTAIISNVKNPYPAITTGQFLGYIGTDRALPNGGSSISLIAGNIINK